jgi:ArsR family transcriptional regulator, arsenate/arsenite/antimonite-responsive transcriptional repressor
VNEAQPYSSGILHYHQSMSLSEKQTILALKAIADPTRLKILRLLKQRNACSLDKSEGLCACDIEEQVRLSQSTVSHHMSVLTKAGLVDAKKLGLWMWYRRNEKLLKQLGETVSEAI